MQTYNSGAKRSDSKPYYREIPLAAIRRLGNTLRDGAEKYNETAWDSNWQKADLDFALDCIDHMIEHAFKAAEAIKARLAGKPTRDQMERGEDEDHLGHLMANAAFLCYFDENGYFESLAATDTPAPEETPNNTQDVVYESLPISERIRNVFAGLVQKA